MVTEGFCSAIEFIIIYFTGCEILLLYRYTVNLLVFFVDKKLPG